MKIRMTKEWDVSLDDVAHWLWNAEKGCSDYDPPKVLTKEQEARIVSGFLDLVREEGYSATWEVIE